MKTTKTLCFQGCKMETLSKNGFRSRLLRTHVRNFVYVIRILQLMYAFYIFLSKSPVKVVEFIPTVFCSLFCSSDQDYLDLQK